MCCRLSSGGDAPPWCRRRLRTVTFSQIRRWSPAAQASGILGPRELGYRPSRFARGANAVALAESFRNDLLVARGIAPGDGQLPPDIGGVQVDGADILVSSIRRVADDARGTGIEVRLTAMSDTGSTALLTGPFTEAITVDLLGRPLSTAPVSGGLELALGPWEIRTVVVR